METKSQGYMSERWHDDSAAPSGVVSNFEETWVDAAYVNKLEAELLALRTRLETAEKKAKAYRTALVEIEEQIYEWPTSAQDIAGIAGRTLRAAHPEANP